MRFPERDAGAAADETAVAELVWHEQPDVILHTAAISDTGYSEKHPEEILLAPMCSCRCWVARAAQTVGAKLRAFSSDQVYAGLTDIGPFAEDTPLSPANVYGRHKLEAEQRVLDARPDAVLLRAAWMHDLPGYGLPIRGNFLLNLLTRWLCRQATLRFLAAGDYRRHHLCARGRGAADPGHGNLPGGVYNFGSENDCDMVHDGTLRACATAGHPPRHRSGRTGRAAC